MSPPAPAPPKRRPWAILRGPFGWLWAGQSVSMLGDGIFLVTLAWVLTVQLRQPALLGLLLSVRVAAELATLAAGGWLVDHIPRRALIQTTDAVRALVLAGIAIAFDRPSTVSLAVLLGAYGVATALFRPALLAYVPEVVPDERLPAANGLLSLSQHTSRIVGPGIGTVLLATGSSRLALYLNGASFLVAAVAALPLPARTPTRTGGGRPRLADVLEGWQVARRVGWIGGSIALVSLVNVFTISAERVALPAVAARRYGQLGGYGALVSAIAAGGVLVSLLVSRTRPARAPGRLAYAAILLAGLATTGLGVAPEVLVAVLLGLILGGSRQYAELQWSTALQQHVPARLLGRVSAIDDLGSFLFLPLAFGFAGILTEQIRPELLVATAGVAGVLAALAGLAIPTLYRWRPIDDHHPE